MAVSVSRKLLRSFYGSLSALGRCDSSTITCRSFLTYHDLYGHLNGQNIFSSGSSCLSKGGSPILANRWLSTSILTSELGEGAFPSNLLSTKPVATAERTIGNTFNKTISAVSGTGRKPWRQRVLVEQGMEHCMDPRGGATMHGLKPRSHAFKLNRKVRRRLGLKIALTARAAEGKGLNVYSILLHDTLVVFREAVNKIVERISN